MRGRYTKGDGKTEQHLELREDDLCNALTTVQKDSLIVEVKQMRDADRIHPICEKLEQYWSK